MCLELYLSKYLLIRHFFTSKMADIRKGKSHSVNEGRLIGPVILTATSLKSPCGCRNHIHFTRIAMGLLELFLEIAYGGLIPDASFDDEN